MTFHGDEPYQGIVHQDSVSRVDLLTVGRHGRTGLLRLLIGSHGRKGFDKLLIGSVTERVIGYTQTGICVVKHR